MITTDINKAYAKLLTDSSLRIERINTWIATIYFVHKITIFDYSE